LGKCPFWRFLLKKCLIIAGMAAVSISQGAVLFYGGDADGRDGLLAMTDPGLDGQVFDDFTLTQTSNITMVWGNYLTTLTGFSTGAFEIRSGMSAGNGGTLVASGSGNVSGVATGRSFFGLNEYKVQLGGLNANLAAGTYHLSLSLFGNGGVAYVSTTSGADAGPGGDPNPAPTGGPLANDNSFFNSTTFGAFYGDTADQHGSAGPWDYSYGVEGTVVPEPTTVFALGVGLAGLLALRRRK
jgi:hypothetical protein